MYFPYTCAWQFDRGLLSGDKVFVFSIQLVMGCKMPGPSELRCSLRSTPGASDLPLGGVLGASWGVLGRPGTSSFAGRTIWGRGPRWYVFCGGTYHLGVMPLLGFGAVGHKFHEM